MSEESTSNMATNISSTSGSSGVLLEWFSQNLHRNYPLDDTASSLALEGASLPSSVLCDAEICLPPIANAPDISHRLFLSSVVRMGGYIRFVISYSQNTTKTYDLLYGDIPVTAASDYYTPVRLSPMTTTEWPAELAGLVDASGTLWVGKLEDLEGYGGLTFDYSAGRLNQVTIRVGATSVNRLSVTDSSGNIHYLTGDVTLEAGTGLSISIVDNSIIISTAGAEDSTESTINEIYEEVLARLGGSPITNINGLSGPSISILGGDCTNITTAGGRIIINNQCSKPCCSEGMPEDVGASIETLMSAKERLLSYFASMSSVLNSIQARLASLITARG